MLAVVMHESGGYQLTELEHFLIYDLVVAVVLLCVAAILSIILYRRLKARNSQYEQVFNASTSAMLVVAEGGGIVAANDTACTLFSLSKDELRGGNIRSLIGQKREAEIRAMKATVAEGRSYTSTGSYIRDDGRRVELEIAVRRFKFRGSWHFLASITDLTARREAELACAASEERYRSLLETMPQGVTTVDAELKITYVNPALGRMLKHDPQAAVGMSAMEFLDAENQEKLTHEIAKRQEGVYESYELTFTRTDGTKVPTLMSPGPLTDEAGRIAGYFAVVQDLSDLQAVEQARSESEARFRAVAEYAPVGIVMHDGGMITYANRQAALLHGALATGDMVGRHILELVAPEYRDVSRRRIEHLAQSDEPLPVVEAEILRLDGATCPVELTSVPIVLSGRRHALAVLHDLSDRRAAEARALRLAKAIEETWETVVVTDANGIIEYVNPAFEKISGYSREEAIGTSTAVLKSGKHNDEFYAELWDTIAGGKTWHGEFINRRKDGTLYQEEATISPIRSPGGTITNYVAVKRDVTQLKRLEQQLRQAQKMESLGTMAGGIAHDFNNILFALMGYAQLMRVDVEEGSLAEKNLKEIIKAGDRLKELVAQILAFSRQSDTGAAEADIVPVVREEAAAARESLPEGARLKFATELDEATVELGEHQLRTVLQHLLSNAVYALEGEPGTITVALKLHQQLAEEARQVKPGAYLELVVSDTGFGIHPDIQDRIFEPFFTTRDVGAGRGMGLAVVHGIVTRRGGTVVVESEFGQGTTMRVLLPLAGGHFPEPPPPAAGEEDRPAEDSPATEPETPVVMVVDDEAAIVSLTTQLFGRRGLSVEGFTSPEAALAAFRANPERYGLLITDEIMPELLGHQLIIACQQLRPGLPAIWLGGSQLKEERATASTASIARSFVKPVDIRQLVAAAQELLDGASD